MKAVEGSANSRHCGVRIRAHVSPDFRWQTNGASVGRNFCESDESGWSLQKPQGPKNTKAPLTQCWGAGLTNYPEQPLPTSAPDLPDGNHRPQATTSRENWVTPNCECEPGDLYGGIVVFCWCGLMRFLFVTRIRPISKSLICRRNPVNHFT